jgi:hypothetical protein
MFGGGRKEQNLSSKKDIENAFLLTTRSSCMLSMNCGKAKSVHRDLNKLRVKLALSKDSSLVKLPPSEAAFRQHILRVAFQVYVWTHANIKKG